MSDNINVKPHSYFVGALNAFTTNKDEAYKMGKLYPVETLYSSSVVEAQAREIEQQRNEVERLQAENTAQTQRADALAFVINDLVKMVTYKDETKDQFVQRVKGILSVDPDSRVKDFVTENDKLKAHYQGALDSIREHQQICRDFKSRVAELEKCIEILQRPLDDEIISRIIALVKSVSDEELASNVFESVRNMTNWNKSTPTEFLVLFDKVASSKNGDIK